MVVFQGQTRNNSIFLQISEPQVFGKKTAKTLIINYRDACKAKIENREFGPNQFGESKTLVNE